MVIPYIPSEDAKEGELNIILIYTPGCKPCQQRITEEIMFDMTFNITAKYSYFFDKNFVQK